MNDASKKESIWLALSTPAFRRYWLAALISGTCAAAHNTAVFSVLGESERSAFVISLMSTLSALPFALFTLPAGALADMVDRKKILYATNVWQAIVGIGLMSLGLASLLSPYFILVSAFLFSVGFAFGSPAAASVQIQMVPKQQLPSAFVLGGLQLNISGVFGPLIGGLLVPLIGSSLIFGANGLGY
ncbi:MAG: MFS transporter, partial [Terrimicrobiaceae bacterium]